MAMTVGDLRRALSGMPDDRLVVLSEDGGGCNGHSPLSSYEMELYEAESTYSGYTYAMDDEDAPDDTVEVVVLYPAN